MVSRAPNYTLRQLVYFVAVADHLSFQKAANACNISQPSLSVQLQTLEENLGVTLVERTRRSVVLTAAGVQILEQAKILLAQADALKDIADTVLGHSLAGPVRLGLNKTLGPYVLPIIMPELREQFPDIRLLPREEHPEQALTMLRDGALDLVMAALPIEENGLEEISLFEEPVLLALPRTDPRAALVAIEDRHLKDTRMLLLASGHRLRSAARALCERVGAIPHDAFEGTSLSMLRQMVAAGEGVSLMTGLYAIADGHLDPAICLRPLSPPQSRTIVMVWRRTAPQREAYRKIAEMIGYRCRHVLAGIDSIINVENVQEPGSQKPYWTSAS